MEHPPLSIAARLRPIVSHSALLLLGASWLLAVHLTFPKGGLRLDVVNALIVQAATTALTLAVMESRTIPRGLEALFLVPLGSLDGWMWKACVVSAHASWAPGALAPATLGADALFTLVLLAVAYALSTLPQRAGRASVRALGLDARVCAALAGSCAGAAVLPTAWCCNATAREALALTLLPEPASGVVALGTRVARTAAMVALVVAVDLTVDLVVLERRARGAARPADDDAKHAAAHATALRKKLLAFIIAWSVYEIPSACVAVLRDGGAAGGGGATVARPELIGPFRCGVLAAAAVLVAVVVVARSALGSSATATPPSPAGGVFACVARAAAAVGASAGALVATASDPLLAFSLFDLYTNYFESTVDDRHPAAAWAFNGTLVVVLAVCVRQEHRRLTEELSQSTHVLMIEHRFGRKLERLAHRNEHVQVQESTPLV